MGVEIIKIQSNNLEDISHNLKSFLKYMTAQNDKLIENTIIQNKYNERKLLLCIDEDFRKRIKDIIIAHTFDGLFLNYGTARSRILLLNTSIEMCIDDILYDLDTIVDENTFNKFVDRDDIRTLKDCFLKIQKEYYMKIKEVTEITYVGE